MLNRNLVAFLTFFLPLQGLAATPLYLNENDSMASSKSAIVFTAPKTEGVLVRKYNHPEPVPSEVGVSGLSMLLGYSRYLSPADTAGQYEQVLKLNGGIARHNLVGTRRIVRFDSERGEISATVSNRATQALNDNHWISVEELAKSFATLIQRDLWLKEIAFNNLSTPLKKPSNIVVANASKDLTITIEPLLEISVDMSTVIMSADIDVYRSPLANLGENPNKSKVRNALKTYRAKADYSAVAAVFLPWGEAMSYMRRERSDEEKAELKAELEAYYTPLYNAEKKKGKKRKIAEAFHEEKKRVDERYGYVESTNFMGAFWLDNNAEQLGNAIVQAKELLPLMVAQVINGIEPVQNSENVSYSDSRSQEYERVLIATLQASQ